MGGAGADFTRHAAFRLRKAFRKLADKLNAHRENQIDRHVFIRCTRIADFQRIHQRIADICPARFAALYGCDCRNIRYAQLHRHLRAVKARTDVHFYGKRRLLALSARHQRQIARKRRGGRLECSVFIHLSGGKRRFPCALLSRIQRQSLRKCQRQGNLCVNRTRILRRDGHDNRLPFFNAAFLCADFERQVFIHRCRGLCHADSQSLAQSRLHSLKEIRQSLRHACRRQKQANRRQDNQANLFHWINLLARFTLTKFSFCYT